MFNNFLHNVTSFRRRTLVVAVALMAPLTTLGLASPASATKPTGDFAIFADCPVTTPELTDCVYSEVISGEVKIGSTAVKITKPIILQGGFIENEKTEVQTFVGATDGNTLSKTPLPVPGGLLGLVKCNEISNFLERIACELIFENGVTGVTATTELAKPASSIGISTANLFNREGTALSLPVKVKLDNPFLGPECYIGSSSNPVTLNLTTGTTNPPPPNKPISGKVGKIEFRDEVNYVKLSENSLVDNSFSAPGATGCGGIFSSLIDPIINGKIGLPSAAGNNTAIQTGTIQEGFAPAVIASEK
jgi:hypothetical protein